MANAFVNISIIASARQYTTIHLIGFELENLKVP